MDDQQLKDQRELKRFLKRKFTNLDAQLFRDFTYFAILRNCVSHLLSMKGNQEIDNKKLFCEHGSLAYDLNEPRDRQDVCFVPDFDWFEIQNLCGGGPPLSVTVESEEPLLLKSCQSVCDSCRKARLLDYQETTIYISERVDPNQSERRTPSNKRRKSTQSKDLEMIITKNMTVQDLKKQIYAAMDVPPFCQKLWHRNVELEQDQILESLEMYPKDVIILDIVEQDMNLLSESMFD